jgi:integrase
MAVRRSFGDKDGRDSSTKSRRVRYVPLLGNLRPILDEWQARCSSELWLFPSASGEARLASDRHLQEHLHVALEAAGIGADTVQGSRGNSGFRVRKRRAFTFHDLRHSFASNWMVEGEDLFMLCKVLGHKSIMTTERYAHLAPEAFDRVRAMGGARDGDGPVVASAELVEENRRLTEEVERLRAETARQQKMIDRLLAS